jgi:DNA polymerase-3 subunit epsilon
MNYDEIVASLEATADFKVLKRVVPRDHIYPPDGRGNRRALYVDAEATGLSPSKNEIIVLAIVPINYEPDCRIFEVLPAFQSLQEPRGPIPAEITRIRWRPKDSI